MHAARHIAGSHSLLPLAELPAAGQGLFDHGGLPLEMILKALLVHVSNIKGEDWKKRMLWIPLIMRKYSIRFETYCMR